MNIITFLLACIAVMFFGALLALGIKRIWGKKTGEGLSDKAVLDKRLMQVFPQAYFQLDLSQSKALKEIMDTAVHFQDADLEDVRLALLNIERLLRDNGFREDKQRELYEDLRERLLKNGHGDLAKEFAERHSVLEEEKIGKDIV